MKLKKNKSNIRKICILMLSLSLLVCTFLLMTSCGKNSYKIKLSTDMPVFEFGQTVTLPSANVLNDNNEKLENSTVSVSVSFDGEKVATPYRSLTLIHLGNYKVVYTSSDSSIKPLEFVVECKDTVAPNFKITGDMGIAQKDEVYTLPNYVFSDASEIKTQFVKAYENDTDTEIPFLEDGLSIEVKIKGHIRFVFYAEDMFGNKTEKEETVMIQSYYTDSALKENELASFDTPEYKSLTVSIGGKGSYGDRGSASIVRAINVEGAEPDAVEGFDTGALSLNRTDHKWYTFATRFATENMPVYSENFNKDYDYLVKMRVYFTKSAPVERLILWDYGVKNKDLESTSSETKHIVIGDDDRGKWTEISFRASELARGEDTKFKGLKMLLVAKGENSEKILGAGMYIDSITYETCESWKGVEDEFKTSNHISDWNSAGGNINFIKNKDFDQTEKTIFKNNNYCVKLVPDNTLTNQNAEFIFNDKLPVLQNDGKGISIKIKLYSVENINVELFAENVNNIKTFSLTPNKWTEINLRFIDDISAYTQFVTKLGIKVNSENTVYVGDISFEYVLIPEANSIVYKSDSKISQITSDLPVEYVLKTNVEETDSETGLFLMKSNGVNSIKVDFADISSLVAVEKLSLVKFFVYSNGGKLSYSFNDIEEYTSLTLADGWNNVTIDAVSVELSSLNFKADGEIYISKFSYEYVMKDNAGFIEISSNSGLNGNNAYNGTILKEDFEKRFSGQSVYAVSEKLQALTNGTWTGTNIHFDPIPTIKNGNKLKIYVHAYTPYEDISVNFGFNYGNEDIPHNTLKSSYNASGWYTQAFCEGMAEWNESTKEISSIAFYLGDSKSINQYIDYIAYEYVPPVTKGNIEITSYTKINGNNSYDGTITKGQFGELYPEIATQIKSQEVIALTNGTWTGTNIHFAPLKTTLNGKKLKITLHAYTVKDNISIYYGFNYGMEEIAHGTLTETFSPVKYYAKDFSEGMANWTAETQEISSLAIYLPGGDAINQYIDYISFEYVE